MFILWIKSIFVPKVINTPYRCDMLQEVERMNARTIRPSQSRSWNDLIILVAPPPGFEPGTFESAVRHSTSVLSCHMNRPIKRFKGKPKTREEAEIKNLFYSKMYLWILLQILVPDYNVSTVQQCLQLIYTGSVVLETGDEVDRVWFLTTQELKMDLNVEKCSVDHSKKYILVNCPCNCTSLPKNLITWCK